VSIAGQSYTVNQPSGCSFVVAPTTIPVGAGGGNSNVTVAAAPGCTWTASSDVNWITIQVGATGNGNGIVTLAISNNPGASRSGTVTVAGQTVTINQAAPASQCVYAIAPDSRGGSGNGGSNTIAVTAGAGCSWTAASNVSWITVTSGASGTGNGTVAFTFAANTSGAARSGTITIAGQTYTQNQAR
jgi:hypothetical protein